MRLRKKHVGALHVAARAAAGDEQRVGQAERLLLQRDRVQRDCTLCGVAARRDIGTRRLCRDRYARGIELRLRRLRIAPRGFDCARDAAEQIDLVRDVEAQLEIVELEGLRRAGASAEGCGIGAIGLGARILRAG